MESKNQLKIKKRNMEEIVDYLITQSALQKLEIDKLQRAVGLAGYLSENPPISIQEHHKILVEKLSELLTDFRIFYEKEEKYMGELFDKKFEGFFKEMENKHLK